LTFDFCLISVDSNTTEGLFADADPKRLAARAKAGAAIGEAFLKHNVRTVDVGNGFYPTDWRAKRYGMSADDLAKTFWGGVNIDYTDLGRGLRHARTRHSRRQDRYRERTAQALSLES
jgi:hypothetical protein